MAFLPREAIVQHKGHESTARSLLLPPFPGHIWVDTKATQCTTKRKRATALFSTLMALRHTWYGGRGVSRSEVSEIKPVLQPIKEVLFSMKPCGVPGSVSRRHVRGLGRQRLLRECWRHSRWEPNPIALLGTVSPILWAVAPKKTISESSRQHSTFRGACKGHKQSEWPVDQCLK